MKKYGILVLLSALCVALSQCHKAGVFPESDYDQRLSGGDATVFDESARAFTRAISSLTGRDLFIHELGDKAFEQTFVSNPSPVNGGLGPLFNNVSCISCHHNDGKGTPTAGQTNSSLLFRISIPGVDDFGGPNNVPGYGGQLQDLALQGRTAEAKIDITYQTIALNYLDGTTLSLRKPTYTIRDSYVPMHAGCMLSPRMAPPVFGLGLLELIPEATIKAMADANDTDGDGISGKPNYVHNPATGKMELGRFGLKAGVSTIELQVASAYHQDMGVTSHIFPKESSLGQPQADAHDYGVELPDSLLHAVTFYIKTLAVPARRDVANANVKRGEQLFTSLQCGSCHRPVLQTMVDVRFPQLSNQRIQPFTDLLLHDMGDGLADNRPDFLADGREWRTAPLWGIGLFEKTNGTPFYLHDGRARSLEEAIAWHGGEAAPSQKKFMELSKSDRSDLIRFLKSL